MNNPYECYYRKSGQTNCLNKKLTEGGFVINLSRQSLWFCSRCDAYSLIEYTPPKPEHTPNLFKKDKDMSLGGKQVSIFHTAKDAVEVKSEEKEVIEDNNDTFKYE